MLKTIRTKDTDRETIKKRLQLKLNSILFSFFQILLSPDHILKEHQL